MKKLILALLLSAGICVAGQSADVFASEPANQEEEAGQNKEVLQTEYVDLSDSVIQEGGFPKKSAGSGRRKSRSASSSNRQQAQAALISAWENYKDSCDVSSYGITVDEMGSIYFETLNTHPEYFYVAGKCSYSYNPSNNIVIKVTITYAVNKNTAMAQKADYDRVVAKVKSNARASWSDMEKALYVNDYLARNCEYDETLKKHTAYDVLVGKTAVCQGYALAFLDLTRELGVSCEMVTSDSVNHAWNMVNIGGKYYHVDVTWNDPVTDLLGRARHIYFMKSTSYFKGSTGGKSHFGTDDWVITGSLTDAAASDSSYDSYFWNNVDAGFDYVSGSWYGFDGSDSICKYSCDGNKFSNVGDVITINETWDTVNGNGHWEGKYVGTGALGGKYYYSGSEAIYSVDVNTKNTTEVFRLSADQKKTGRIYGMNITSAGIFQYVLSASPDGSDPKTIYIINELSECNHESTRTEGKKEATCTQEGYTGDVYCNYCGVRTVTGKSIPAAGHSFGAWKTTVNPKAGVVGKKARVCTVCKKTEEGVIPALEKKDVKVSSIKISTPLSYQIAEGKKVALKVIVFPDNASNKGVIWKSSNTKVAKVDQKGKVTVLKKSGGKKAVITATAKDGSGVKKSVTIKSMKGAVKSISISGKNKVKAGKSISLKAKVKTAKGANKKVVWSSSNSKAATVSASGKVTTKSKAKGKSVKITATAADGSGKKKSFTIKIQ